MAPRPPWYTDTPSTSTSPLSGTMSPIVVLSSTLFPVPDGPKSANISPLSTVRLTPASTGRSNALCTPRYEIIGPRSSLQHQRREHRVEDQERQDHEHHGVR